MIFQAFKKKDEAKEFIYPHTQQKNPTNMFKTTPSPSVLLFATVPLRPVVVFVSPYPCCFQSTSRTNQTVGSAANHEWHPMLSEDRELLSPDPRPVRMVTQPTAMRIRVWFRIVRKNRRLFQTIQATSYTGNTATATTIETQEQQPYPSGGKCAKLFTSYLFSLLLFPRGVKFHFGSVQPSRKWFRCRRLRRIKIAHKS